MDLMSYTLFFFLSDLVEKCSLKFLLNNDKNYKIQNIEEDKGEDDEL
jgi:hypothetical protein